MNRDKNIILLLAVLLLLSLAANVLLWRRSRVSPAPAAAVAAARSEGTREREGAAAYEIVANPEMKGRLGRIVLTFADAGESLESTRTAIYKPGSESLLKTSYGPVAAELVPGVYDLEVNGRELAGIPVEAGKDTRIPSGVLRFHGSENTRFVVYEVGATEKYIYIGYGNSLRGLPAGDYEIEVSGQREKVTIEPGKVTEF